MLSPRLLMALAAATAAAALLAGCGAVGPKRSAVEAPTPEHAWLQQLLGEWELRYRADMPDGEPMEWTGTESVRALGTHWVLAESAADSQQGSFEATLTLGYDTGRETFVATWIDSMQTNLWTYDASLDDARRTLSLTPTIAPRPEVPDPTRYRDDIELVDPDHRILTSWYRGDDGSWQRYLTVEAHRVR